MRKKRRLHFIAIMFLTLVLVGTSVDLAAFTVFASEESCLAEDKTIVPETDLPDNEELFTGYVEQQFYSNGGISLYGLSAGRGLNEQGKNLYDFLKEEIKNVAAGTTVSTVFIVDADTLKSWNATISFNTTDTEAASASFWEQFEMGKILDALLHDCPYELYWFDKTSGINMYSSLQGIENSITIDYIKIIFAVAENYGDPESNTVDGTKAIVANTAVANAQSIVTANADKSDYEKLLAYRDEICGLVSYNNSAAASGNFSENDDPWQLVYVFDNDTSTNVVCEGYSKAFQYLCDLTTFTDDIFCYTVNGSMYSSTSGGAHMWNVVTMENGKNYLADVTNSDTGTVGSGGGLFLAGTSGSVSDGYIFALSKNLTYSYNSDMLELWGLDDSSILNLDESSYVQKQKIDISEENVTINEVSYIYDGTEKQPEVVVGNLTEDTDYRVSYSNNINAGTATVTITGRNMYTGTVIKEFTINPKEITNPTIELSENSYEYDGNEKKPTVVLKDGDLEIDSSEYTISYSNNIDAGTATVTIKNIADGNYIVDGLATFTIAGKTLTKDDVVITIENTTYNGNPQRQTVIVQYGTDILTEDMDYSVSYPDDCINAGSKNVMLTFLGNYTGNVSTSYEIEKAVISDISATLNSITAPEAGVAVEETVASQTGYYASILWNCSTKEFGFNTEYTVTVTLTLDSNYKFADSINTDGFDIEVNADGTLNLSKTFDATRKEKVISIPALENMTLIQYHEDLTSVVEELPNAIHVVTESGNVTMEPVWNCENYDNAFQVQNIFTWNINPDSYEDYDFTGITHSGQIVVSNMDGIDVKNIGTNSSNIYSFMGVYDVSSLFDIDENAGTASYEIMEGSTGEGNLEGSKLTVTKEGTFIIKLTTAANKGYKEGTATATLTLNKVKNPPNIPDETISTPYSSEVVGDVILSEGWEWKEADKTTVLKIGETVTATAVYTGEDKVNYENIEITIFITRAACEHVAGETLYTLDGEKAPTCTESGLGHKECINCHEVMETGIVEEASGHVLSKVEKIEATSEKTGQKEYWFCIECEKKYTDAEGKTEITDETDLVIPITQSTTEQGETETPGSATEQDEMEIPGSTTEQNKTESSPAVGTILSDTKTKAAYKVITSDVKAGTVAYTKSIDSKAKTITIPETVTMNGITYKVTKIENNAFKNNKNITKITIGNNVTIIGKNAFNNCKKLKTLILGKNVTTIGDKAFYKCIALTKITIPTKVNKIGKQAFYGCKKLKNITIKTTNLTKQNVGSKAFKGIHSKAVIKVPKKKLKSYKSLLKVKGVSSKAKIKK